MAERLKMAGEQAEADVVTTEDGGTPYQKGGFLDIQKSIKPVTLADPNNTPRKWGLTGLFGRGSSGSATGANEGAPPESTETAPEAGGPGRNGGSGEGNGGDGGGPEGPRGPEGPELPEGLSGPENEANPELGRWLVEQIVEMRTNPNLSYEQRYSGENGRRLRWLYKSLEIFVDKISEIRNDKDPWDRYNRAPVLDEDGNQVVDQAGNVITRITGIKRIDETPLAIEYEEIRDDQGRIIDRKPVRLRPTEPTQQVETTQSREQDPEIPNLEPVDILTEEYVNGSPTPERFEEVKRQLGKYFVEADRLGLLKGANEILLSIRDDIESSPAQQVRARLNGRIEMALEAIHDIWNPMKADAQYRRLAGIEQMYVRWARERFNAALAGLPLRGYVEGEFRLDQIQEEENRRERYWEIGNYPKYYHVSARTPEQLLIAKETFFEMIRKGYLGKDPSEIYQHVDNFKEVFAQRAGELVDSGVINGQSLIEQKEELEGLLFVFGADYSNETYNPEQYKKFMMAMALHEGPARWVRVLRSGNGQVAAFTELFDQETLMEIYNNPVGERGELNIIAQHYLQDQIREIAIEGGIGIVLKDYDPDHPDDPSRTLDDEYARALRIEQSKANLEQLGLHVPGRKIQDLYEGFGKDDKGMIKGDSHLYNFRLHGNKSREEVEKLPKSLQDSINLGRIQTELQEIRAKIRRGEIKFERRDQKAVDFLPSKDKKAYTDAYDKTEGNFDVAFQMQGASGEKVRRGRGFFYIERNPHVQLYNQVEERSSRIKWLLNELQKYTDSKGKEGKSIEDFGKEVQDFYSSLTEQDKKINSQGLYGINSSRFTPDQLRSIGIGWMLSEMEDHRRLDSFSPEEQAFYNGLSENEKSSYEDHIPTYLAEKAVQTIVTRTKIQYSNAKAIGNKSGAEIRTEAVAKARADAIKQIKKDGWKAKFELPKILFDEQGEVVGWDDNTKETMDFQTAAQHIYSRYTTNTYWGYQGENRHMMPKQDIVDAAKRIRSGQSRPEDEDMLASQLLTVDPTLKRIKRFPTGQIKREIQLLQAAVNESFLGHVYINKDLFKEFLPRDGHRGKMHSGYNMEDWGGMMRFTMGIKELSASQPERFTRRLGAEIAIMPIYIDSMAAIWGGDGVLGAVSMFADKIKDIGHQGIVSQFGITKFINNQDRAVALYNALIGTVNDQEGKHVEGLFMKPTNDNEMMHKFTKDRMNNDLIDNPVNQLEFLKQLRATLARLETVLKIMRIMYSDDRNAGGALRLENVDIFLENGRFNPAIENDPEIYMMTGTSRQLESDFYDEFASWLTSEWPGGGGEIYPEELVWNKWLAKKLYVFNGKVTQEGTKTFKRWFFEKAGL